MGVDEMGRRQSGNKLLNNYSLQCRSMALGYRACSKTYGTLRYHWCREMPTLT